MTRAEREAFEAWFDPADAVRFEWKRGVPALVYTTSTPTHDEGEIFRELEEAWDAWQARAALPEPAQDCPEGCGACTGEHCWTHTATGKHCDCGTTGRHENAPWLRDTPEHAPDVRAVAEAAAERCKEIMADILIGKASAATHDEVIQQAVTHACAQQPTGREASVWREKLRRDMRVSDADIQERFGDAAQEASDD